MSDGGGGGGAPGPGEWGEGLAEGAESGASTGAPDLALSTEELLNKLRIAHELKKDFDRRKLEGIVWTEKQREALCSRVRRVAFCGGNQVGKTFTLRGWVSYHATGMYPSWWSGTRYEKPVTILVGGESRETTRDVITDPLLGGTELGVGMIPGECLDKERMTWAVGGGSGGMVDRFYVKHYRGWDSDRHGGMENGWSCVNTFSYKQGRASLQGRTADLIAIDEEPGDFDVYRELDARLNATRGELFMAYTPMRSWTRLYNLFAEGDPRFFHLVTQRVHDTTWMDEETRREWIEENKDAHDYLPRIEGRPTIGEGAVFPIVDSDIVVKSRELPRDWPRIIGVDLPHTTGTFAAVKLAKDPESGVVYVVSEYKAKGVDRVYHAERLRGMGGDEIPIAWPHDGSREYGGEPIVDWYRKNGLAFCSESAHYLVRGTKHSRSKGAAVQEIRDRMCSGTMKVFDTCVGWLREKSLYRQEDGFIVKGQDDHLLDATMKALMFLRKARAPGGDYMGVAGVSGLAQGGEGVVAGDWDFFG